MSDKPNWLNYSSDPGGLWLEDIDTNFLKLIIFTWKLDNKYCQLLWLRWQATFVHFQENVPENHFVCVFAQDGHHTSA